MDPKKFEDIMSELNKALMGANDAKQKFMRTQETLSFDQAIEVLRMIHDIELQTGWIKREAAQPVR